MASTNLPPPADTVEQTLASVATLLSESTNAATSTATTSRQLLESQLDGPSGVVQTLLSRVFLPSSPPRLQGDHALQILSHLVQTHPETYMALTAHSVRLHVEHQFGSTEVISDALLAALCHLLLSSNSDNQVGIATDAHEALLALCRWDHRHSCQTLLTKRLLSTLDSMWEQLPQREAWAVPIRITTLVIDLCLLGNQEFLWARDITKDNNYSILQRLLQLALDHPSTDPLLQMSALDQLERLTSQPMHVARAQFLLGNDALRRGLFILLGSNDIEDSAIDGEWGEMDPTNGLAALRLLTEICQVGIQSFSSIEQDTWEKFQVLMLPNFQRALHNFYPQGEGERLSYIHAVSSLFASFSRMARSGASESTTLVTNQILQDRTLLHEWLSMYTRASQPKLKSALLYSIALVMEPGIGKEDPELTTSNLDPRPNDAIVLQLYQAFSDANNHRDSTECLLSSAKSPFVEERLGAYSVFRALVMRGMGMRLLLSYSDTSSSSGSGSSIGKSVFMEWLLNPDNEPTSDGKMAKYQIGHAILSCNGNFIRGVLPEKTLRELELWKTRGPYYAPTKRWETLTE